ALGLARLLLATGAEPRRLPAADGSGARVAYLRTLDDSRALRAALVEGGRVVIVGGGWGRAGGGAARGAGGGGPGRHRRGRLDRAGGGRCRRDGRVHGDRGRDGPPAPVPG